MEENVAQINDRDGYMMCDREAIRIAIILEHWEKTPQLGQKRRRIMTKLIPRMCQVFGQLAHSNEKPITTSKLNKCGKCSAGTMFLGDCTHSTLQKYKLLDHLKWIKLHETWGRVTAQVHVDPDDSKKCDHELENVCVSQAQQPSCICCC